MKLIHLNAIVLMVCVLPVIADDCARVSWTGADPPAGEIGNGMVEHCPGQDPQGRSYDIDCTPLRCQKDQGCDTCCKVGDGTYEEGCCLGTDPDCAEAEQCWERCPDFEEICTATETCENAACTTCEPDSQGNDIWQIKDLVQDFDCINTGYKTLAGNGTDVDVARQDGLTYKWAIVCGPMVSGGTFETNYGPGQYACRAFRTGAGLTHDDALASDLLPVHWIQLGECGCGPADMATFGLPDPTGPCVTEEDCIFLAQDAPGDVAKNLCHAFDKFSDEDGFQGIDWWEEPINFIGIDIFAAFAPSGGEIAINVVEEVGSSSSTNANLHCAMPIIIMACIIYQIFMV